MSGFTICLILALG
jgi:ribonuclease VapC